MWYTNSPICQQFKAFMIYLLLRSERMSAEEGSG